MTDREIEGLPGTDLLSTLGAWSHGESLHCQLHGRAAAEILRLDKRIAALEADRDSWQEQASQRVADCERFIERIAALEKENNHMRASLANSGGPCAYCNLPRERWGECASGFPGCARMDDAMLCPHVGAELESQERIAALEANWAGATDTCSALHKRIAALEAALEQARVALESIKRDHWTHWSAADVELVNAVLRKIEEVRRG